MSLGVAAAGFGAFVFDLIVLRFMADKDNSPVSIHPEAGGHVYYIPIWIIGSLAMIGGVIAWLLGFGQGDVFDPANRSPSGF